MKKQMWRQSQLSLVFSKLSEPFIRIECAIHWILFVVPKINCSYCVRRLTKQFNRCRHERSNLSRKLNGQRTAICILLSFNEQQKFDCVYKMHLNEGNMKYNGIYSDPVIPMHTWRIVETWKYEINSLPPSAYRLALCAYCFRLTQCLCVYHNSIFFPFSL